MLNRLYIVVGVLAILALAAAFVVPSFIPWGNYRDRLAEIAGEVLGAPVRIDGDISFTLLPNPRLEFSGVSAGPPDAPNLTVQSVEAEFSLIDFIRDRYTLTRLALTSPHVEIHVGSDGTVDTGIALPTTISTSNISVANATISDGAIRITDSRSGEAYLASDVAGELKLDALRGPFSFAGSGIVDGRSYGLRFTTGLLAEDGSATLSASLRPADERYTLSVEGTLKPGLLPAFSGTMSYRQPPPKRAEGGKNDAGQGDFVVTSRVEASPAKVLLGDYTVIPDENRAATRLVGAADLSLGTTPKFNAVISGGVMALPPRDATAEQAVEPYELVRLLRELPIPTAPAIGGTVGIDIAELDLRAFSLRNVRLDAQANNGGWDVQQFTGELPGETKVTLAGHVSTDTGHPEFSGTVSVATPRLDALATLWRKPADGNPLFNMPGTLEARADLVGETLSLSDGKLTLDGATQSFSAQLGVGSTRDIHLNADLGTLDPRQSAALFALLPDPQVDPQFGVTFPSGEFGLTADALTVDGLDGKGLSASGSWDGGVLVLDHLSAGDLGGAAFDVNLTAFGSFERPELSGTGTLKLASADAPAATRFFNAIETPPAVRTALAASFPAALTLKLAAPSGEGAQTLGVTGTVGPSTLDATANLSAGFLRALGGTFKLEAKLDSTDPTAMTAQLGLGDVSLFPEDQPMHLAGVIEGDIGASLTATLRAQGGSDSLGFSGNFVVTDPNRFTGKGTLKATLADPAPLVARLGGEGLSLPPLSGSATLEFNGAQSVALTGIEGSGAGGSFSGQLAFSKPAEIGQVSGSLAVAGTDVAGLVRTLLGPAALLQTSGGVWPDGPLATGSAARTTTGRVDVTVPRIGLADRAITDASFTLDWDATNTRIRNFAGHIGTGGVSLELGVCCAGPLTDKQLTGRVSLTQVALDDIAPATAADALGGTLDAAGRFDATSGSISGLLGALTGEGTYTVDGLSIARLDPKAIADVTGLDSILQQQPEQLTALIEDRLDDTAFTAPHVTGSFTIAGGVLRSPNLTVTGESGSLFGSSQLRLADLGLSGSYSVTPTAVAPASLVDASSAEITANLGGTLLAPTLQFDVSGLVDAIMVKAYEAEVARLEQLRAEDEARKKAEEAEQARIEAEAKAAAEAAAKKAADEAAAQKAAEEAAAAAQKKADDDAAAAKKAADEAAAKKAADDAAAAAKKKADDEAAAKKKADDEAAAMRAQEEALKKADEEANKPLDLFGN